MSFGFLENGNKFAAVSVANTLDFPEFTNADSEIFITQHSLEHYSIEFSFDLPKEPHSGDWRSYVSLNMSNMSPGSSFSYTVVKTSPNSLSLQIDFENSDIEPTT